MNVENSIKPWANLYFHYKRIPYNPSENHRKFKSWTGVDPHIAELIFLKYFHRKHLPNRSRLLIVLHFLKTMPTEDEGASQFKIKSRTTYRKQLWQSINYLDYIMEEVDIQKRLIPYVPSRGIFANVSLIVDATDCPVERPKELEDRLQLSNGRLKENIYSRYNFKYSIACQITTGTICAIIGPDVGSMTDIQGLKNGELVGIISSWDPLEVIIADKGYQGHPKCLTPFKGTISPEEDAFNQVLASVRILVECVIQRLKIFGVLGRSASGARTVHTKQYST